MMWQDRQKEVSLDRSRCSESPQNPQRTGRPQKARKARIFPAVVVVKGPGRRRMISRAIVVPSRIKSIAVGPGTIVSFGSQLASEAAGGSNYIRA
jgi:hypothetical protein